MRRHSLTTPVLAIVLVFASLALLLPVPAAAHPLAPSVQSAAPEPRRPLAPATPVVQAAVVTRPLGWINDTSNTSGSGNVTRISFVLTSSLTPMPDNGEYFDLGDGRYHTAPDVSNFTAASDHDFGSMATMVTDGVNDWAAIAFWLPDGSGGSLGASESYWFHGNPDLVGHQIDFILLRITALTFVPSGGSTTITWSYSWEFWGHPLFVFFVPPTDPDGYTLVDRTATQVRVGLAGPGNATLEWNAANVSMSPSGANWTAVLSNLTNGVYTYRVWATNATGAVFVTPSRMLTVGVGIFVLQHLGIGFWASTAASPNGTPAVCSDGGAGTTYTEHRPSGWTNTTIGGAGGPCSLAFDRSGNPHASFPSFFGGNYLIEYANRSGTAWTRTDLDQGYYSPTSLAINPVTDLPLIAYTQVPTQGLKLATLSGGVWTTAIVNASDQGQSAWLAVDPSGHPWIAYVDWPASELWVARYDGSAWAFLPVAPLVTAASLAFDPAGVAHLAFANTTGLQYATWNGTGWSTETVDPLRYYSVSLAFDAAGHPCIGYAMNFAGDIRVAEKNGTWSVRVVSHRNGNTAGVSLTPLPGGAVGLVFDVNDTNGDLVFASDVKDTVPPTTTATAVGTPGTNGWYRSTVQVTLTAQDDWSGVRNTTWSLDGSPWTAYVAPITVDRSGRHVLEYRSADNAGNVEPIRTLDVNIDATPPTVLVSVSPLPGAYGWAKTNETVTISATDAVSGVASITYRVDTGAWATYTAPFVVSDGIHVVGYRATDVAGNTAAIQNATVKVDTRPPVTTATVSGTAGRNGWFVSPAVVNLQAVDTESGVASLDYRVDNGTWVTYTVPFTLGDGSHAISFYATDIAGNFETARSLFVRVDTTPPTLSGLSDGHYTTSQVVLSWTGADATSGIARYEVRVDGGAFRYLGWNETTTLLLADGTHQISVRATDVAGNSVTQTVTVTVDTNAFSFSGPYSGIPTVAIVVALGAVALVVLLRRRRKAA